MLLLQPGAFLASYAAWTLDIVAAVVLQAPLETLLPAGPGLLHPPAVASAAAVVLFLVLSETPEGLVPPAAVPALAAVGVVARAWLIISAATQPLLVLGLVPEMQDQQLLYPAQWLLQLLLATAAASNQHKEDSYHHLAAAQQLRGRLAAGRTGKEAVKCLDECPAELAASEEPLVAHSH